jgi:MEDS: MEthanogen/methylotroph, DcmR Sensory domain
MGDAAVDVGGPAAGLSGHVCTFVRGRREHDAVVVPFLREGLRAGHKCVCLSRNADALIATVGEVGEGMLEVRSPKDLGDYPTSRSMVLDFVTESLEVATNQQGFRHALLMEDISGELNANDVTGVVQYEIQLHDYLRRFGGMLMEVHNLERLGWGSLMGALKLHRHTIVGTKLVENAFHLEPHEFRARLGG